MATVLFTLVAYSFTIKAQANSPCLLPWGGVVVVVEARMSGGGGGLCPHASCRQAEEQPSLFRPCTTEFGDMGGRGNETLHRKAC